MKAKERKTVNKQWFSTKLSAMSRVSRDKIRLALIAEYVIPFNVYEVQARPKRSTPKVNQVKTRVQTGSLVFETY